uniref:Uncharacterized protein n=1 Tax=Panagrolaimus superbus TaxID=310955 RepID=A0A914XWA4_9BILA
MAARLSLKMFWNVFQKLKISIYQSAKNVVEWQHFKQLEVIGLFNVPDDFDVWLFKGLLRDYGFRGYAKIDTASGITFTIEYVDAPKNCYKEGDSDSE